MKRFMKYVALMLLVFLLLVPVDRTSAAQEQESRGEMTLKGTTETVTGNIHINATASKGTAVITWNRVKGVTGYELYMSMIEKGTYTRIARIADSTVSFRKTGLLTGKSYYFKIRPFRQSGNLYTYGTFSSPVAVKMR